MSIIIWTILILSISIKVFFKTPKFKMMFWEVSRCREEKD